MRTILYLIPHLDYSGAARQLTLLATGLAADRFRVHVCALGPPSPWGEMLRKAGVATDELGWRRFFDPLSFLALRRLIASLRPDVIHVWGSAALRCLALCPHGKAALVASAALPPGRTAALVDRWLLRKVARILALGDAEAEQYQRLGVTRERVAVAAPAQLPAQGKVEADASLVPNGRMLLGIGPLETHKGFREGVWALDILHYLDPDLHLVLAGNGPDRERVEAFARALRLRSHVHFVGPRADLGPLLARADVVWVPSLRRGGRGAALEAMAAGRPVVASRLPELAETVVEGVNGYLVEPRDKTALARQTRILLDDAGRRAAFGAAGQRLVAERFTVAQLVERAARLYDET